MRVKICGVTRYEDAIMVTEAGADMIGLNFYRPSPRYLAPAAAADLIDRLRAAYAGACPVLVGVFVNAPYNDISDVIALAGLDFVQLSGDESDSVLHELRGQGYKAIRPPNMALALEDTEYYSKEFINDERIPSLLLDAYHPKLYGGTGEVASTEVAVAVRERVPRLMLAGGLNPANVAERVRQVRPWGVDVASGVELADMPGVKDADKVRQFINAVHSA